MKASQIYDALTHFAKDNYEINCSLALNESLPLEYLQQLQIDHRLLNYLKNNKTFTENILHNLGIWYNYTKFSYGWRIDKEVFLYFCDERLRPKGGFALGGVEI